MKRIMLKPVLLVAGWIALASVPAVPVIAAVAAQEAPFVLAKICGADERSACKVGAVGPAGGFIFFVDYNKDFESFDYLEAAPENARDLSVSTAGDSAWAIPLRDLFIWCDTASRGAHESIYDSGVNKLTDYWKKNALGQGKTSTQLMLNNCAQGAAHAANNYRSAKKSFKDWYLPNITELLLMVNTLRNYGLGSFYRGQYWSSSELDLDTAENRVMPDGDTDHSDKSGNSHPVHAMRSWKYP